MGGDLLDSNNKSYAIGDVSKILNVETHTIRFWTEQFSGVVSPRIGFGKRRYYSDDDVRVLAKIQNMLHVRGLKIKAVREVLENEKLCGAHGVINSDFQTIISSIATIRGELSSFLALV
jgi:DNA-binding transcriptional MerR regulator